MSLGITSVAGPVRVVSTSLVTGQRLDFGAAALVCFLDCPPELYISTGQQLRVESECGTVFALPLRLAVAVEGAFALQDASGTVGVLDVVVDAPHRDPVGRFRRLAVNASSWWTDAARTSAGLLLVDAKGSTGYAA